MKNRIFLPRSRASWPVAVLFVAGLVVLAGCAKYPLKMKDSDPEFKPYTSKTMHAFAWGTLYNPMQITAGCNTETGINDVVVKRTYLHDLASVFTFGIWMPIEVAYRCQASPGETIHLE